MFGQSINLIVLKENNFLDTIFGLECAIIEQERIRY